MPAGLAQGDTKVGRAGSGVVGAFCSTDPDEEADPAGAADAAGSVSVDPADWPGAAGSADPLVAVGSLDPAGPVSGSGRGSRGSSSAPRDPASFSAIQSSPYPLHRSVPENKDAAESVRTT